MHHNLTNSPTMLAKEHNPPLKVSELVAMLKREVEGAHRHVRVIGEIASFKQWHSGHCYFDIKDEQALIPSVMFKAHAARVPFKVSDGQQVLLNGRISVYAANARLQMVVESMEPLGQGALALAFLQLKERLDQEGLFLVDHKKPLRLLNETIGIVTSSHGAALRDMIKIIKSRMPKTSIKLASVRVQGVGAKEEIAAAIARLDRLSCCDVIIVGRGGGSLEDLWPFNEELVARAIFAAKTPIISAVGHETDTTISDFVADIRAATPTHGALIATFLESELLSQLRQDQERLKAFQQAVINRAQLSLLSSKKRLTDPRVLLFRHWQSVDELAKRLQERGTRSIKNHRSELNQATMALQKMAPWRMLRRKKEALFALQAKFYKLGPDQKLKTAAAELLRQNDKLHATARTLIGQKRDAFLHHIAKLEALSPLAVLRRGFSLVSEKSSGRLLTNKTSININDSVNIRLQDGIISAQITAKE